jgi:GNAT superfamily N-acetyltransferase
MKLRPFEDRDYPRLVQIRNALFPDYLENEAEYRRSDDNWEHHLYFKTRLVAENDAGDVVAMGQINHMPHQFHPDKYFLSIGVDPQHQRQGIGSALYEELLERLRQRQAVLVRGEAKEDMPDSVTFLRHRGFEEVQRFWESRLDPHACDESVLAGSEARVAGAGIEIVTLEQEMARLGPEGALRAAYELDRDVSRDIPMTDPMTETSYEHFRKGALESPNFLPQAWYIAKDGETYAGLTNLWKSQEQPDVVYQGLTGVRREYRRKGIALALKLQGLRFARAQGYREIRTWNNTRNRPMLGINEAMGFQKQPAWIEFEKALT